jgi:molecular chaperone GrpE
MSFSDGTLPDEEVTPDESELVTDGDAPESDAAQPEVEPEAGPESGPEAEPEAEPDPMTVLAGERDEYLLALQRTQADFENYRKRISRMQDEQSARAASDLVSKLLPVLDTLDLAQAHQSEESADSEDAKALSAARAVLLDTLAKEGLERVDAAEVPFDPAVHDAVAKTEGEDGDVVIDEVLRSGYRWRGQVLRPAMVRVRG